MQSPSLELGRSYLPGHFSDVSKFVARAARAIRRHPDCSADIALAAMSHLIESSQVPAESLRDALQSFVRASALARDQSTTP
jgi:hypothetical protein